MDSVDTAGLLELSNSVISYMLFVDWCASRTVLEFPLLFASSEVVPLTRAV